MEECFGLARPPTNIVARFGWNRDLHAWGWNSLDFAGRETWTHTEALAVAKVWQHNGWYDEVWIDQPNSIIVLLSLAIDVG